MQINNKNESSKNGVRGVQRIKKKKCCFPGCDEEFLGRGKAKYCSEHRKAKYRKDLYKLNQNEGEGIFKYEHQNYESKTIIKKCALQGCKNQYELKILPRTFDYPNYCPEHRNEYKREIFLKERKNDGTVE